MSHHALTAETPPLHILTDEHLARLAKRGHVFGEEALLSCDQR